MSAAAPQIEAPIIVASSASGCPDCRAQIDGLYGRIRRFVEMMEGDDFPWPDIKSLTQTERRILWLLKQKQPKPCSQESLMTALYFDTVRDEPNPKIIDIYICKLRKKLIGHKIHIETFWGFGFGLVDGEDPTSNRFLFPRGRTPLWTPEEDEIIRESLTVTEAAIECGRTPASTWQRARKIGHHWKKRRTHVVSQANAA